MSELMLDVSASVPFDATTCLAASVHLPDIAAAAPRAVLVCWPGGSYGRAYWDMQIPGYPGYSFADHVTAQGYLVATENELIVPTGRAVPAGRAHAHTADHGHIVPPSTATCDAV